MATKFEPYLDRANNSALSIIYSGVISLVILKCRWINSSKYTWMWPSWPSSIKTDIVLSKSRIWCKFYFILYTVLGDPELQESITASLARTMRKYAVVNLKQKKVNNFKWEFTHLYLLQNCFISWSRQAFSGLQYIWETLLLCYQINTIEQFSDW